MHPEITAQGLFSVDRTKERFGPDVPPTTGKGGCWCLGPIGSDLLCPCRMRTLGLKPSRVPSGDWHSDHVQDGQP